MIYILHCRQQNAIPMQLICCLQTAFLNPPESKQIFPTIVGNIAVQNPYSAQVMTPAKNNVHERTYLPMYSKIVHGNVLVLGIGYNFQHDYQCMVTDRIIDNSLDVIEWA